jgi:hypothetical protein
VLQAVIESPASGQSVYDEAIFISVSIDSDPSLCRLRAHVDERCSAETGIFPRPDFTRRHRRRCAALMGIPLYVICSLCLLVN